MLYTRCLMIRAVVKATTSDGYYGSAKCANRAGFSLGIAVREGSTAHAV